MSEAKTTTNHKEIRKWVEARGGQPARVKRTGRGSDQGILRIDYPGFRAEEALEQISWPEWFDTFEEHELAFVYQDRVRTGAMSRFSKLVSREGKAATPQRGSAAKRTTIGIGRTTRKAPRALAARTSKQPAKKKAGATATPKRSAKKRSTKKRAASGRAKRK